MSRESLLSSLVYEPRCLRFGTSGRRGDVVDLTQLEIYINALAELEWMQSMPVEEGGIVRGDEFHFGFDLRPSSTRFVPEQGGRGEIAQAVVQAIRDAGMKPVNMGCIPTPALAFCALSRRKGSIMVTGSHIPFERNGYKANTSVGELLKEHEGPINRRVELVRSRVYGQTLAESPFDARGSFKTGPEELPPVEDAARREYRRRYDEFFAGCPLTGLRILVYQHSAVGRDLLVEVLRLLGAVAVPAGRSDSFVPIDTENVDASLLERMQELVDDHANRDGPFDAVVSTDGDSDRPLILGIDPDSGRVCFFPGDLVGMVVAEYLGADAVVVPVSCNDAIERGSLREVLEPRTRIGSPYVIAGMDAAKAKGRRAVCGWEANGGFLTGSDFAKAGKVLAALPTRDAFLPILAVLHASRKQMIPLTDLFKRLPRRFGSAALLKKFPRSDALEIIRALRPKLMDVAEASFDGETATAVGMDGLPMSVPAALAVEVRTILRRLARFFPTELGFGSAQRINYVDGVRIYFSNDEVAHLRPSGNADEFRIYSVADSPARAVAIAHAGVAEPDGIIREIGRWVRSCETLSARPTPLPLRGRVQHYEWGGFDFIPGLLGAENSERRPFAELWFGDHPKAVAEVASGRQSVALDELISCAPETLLGPSTVARFGPRLPFLLKVLDVRAMLSIQVHPNLRQAAEGFDQEEAAGIERWAPDRNYRDANHKPEVHVALTDFWMLHGFRPLEEIEEVLHRSPELGALMPDFQARLDCAGNERLLRCGLLRDLYAVAMTMPQERVDLLLDKLVTRIASEPPDDRMLADFWVLRAAKEFGGTHGHYDRGLFSIYLLNLVRLRPGQGTFQPAGILHAYLEGVTVELMANSDNVLRGGLTPKHVDTTALLEVVDFQDGRPAILEGTSRSDDAITYETPAAEFELTRITIEPGRFHNNQPSDGPAMVVVIEGSVAVQSGERVLEVGRGGAFFLPAGVVSRIDSPTCRAVLFRAGVPRS